MKLEEIGFYTLTDDRAKNSCINSPLWRNEMIITSRCNFKCPYCRGTEIDGLKNGGMSLNAIKRTINIWAQENVQNVRFSGGEPTLHPDIRAIIKYTKETCVDIKHIAISTNGFSDIRLYKELIELGVNDFSISLDACCSSVGDMMSGGVKGSWSKVISNIKELSKLSYVTVGAVFDKQNSDEMRETIEFAHNLGVADIRIISAAQWDDFSIFEDLFIDEEILDCHPILKYRINNFRKGKNVRGITETDSHRCGLILDDTIVKGNYHYPCVIKMREGCSPLGEVEDNMREKRLEYFNNHDCFKDVVCNKNCLDVCVEYNNTFIRERIGSNRVVSKKNSASFTFDKWESGSIYNIEKITQCRYANIVNEKETLLKYIKGYCFAENLSFKPKKNHVAVFVVKDDNEFWFHLRNNEFFELVN